MMCRTSASVYRSKLFFSKIQKISVLSTDIIKSRICFKDSLRSKLNTLPPWSKINDVWRTGNMFGAEMFHISDSPQCFFFSFFFFRLFLLCTNFWQVLAVRYRITRRVVCMQMCTVHTHTLSPPRTHTNTFMLMNPPPPTPPSHHP